MQIKTFQSIILIFISLSIFSQKSDIISGRVSDNDNNPLPYISVQIKNTSTAVITDERGYFEFKKIKNGNYTLLFSSIGYTSDSINITKDNQSIRNLHIILSPSVQEINQVNINARSDNSTSVQIVKMKNMNLMPSLTGNIESIVKTLTGVSSNNELSSQYKVRGGSYDDNLVYVNGIEIFKPQLIRTGQQEGLSFVNPEMVSSLKFSAGGFDASYGDKMSSVLDVSYKKPIQHEASVSGSLLGASAHFEGASLNNRFTYNIGIRYKTTKYVLGTLETKGQYQPNFSDVQTLFEYQFNEKISFGLLSNISQNDYLFIPDEQNTKFGTEKNAKNITIFYEGMENDRFTNITNALLFNFRSSNEHKLSATLSQYSSIENVRYDILGEYSMNQMSNTSSSDTSVVPSIGGFLYHARNKLSAQVLSSNIVSEHTFDRNVLKYGITVQQEIVKDQINEWDLIDSVGYVSPSKRDNINLSNVLRAKNNLLSTRLSFYISNLYKWTIDSTKYRIITGARCSYWDFNKELIVSPRVSLNIKPNFQKDILFYFSTGLYYQPPFYKEMRMPDASVNQKIKAQQSYQFIVGGDYIFSMWNRPFKFTSELYVKWFNNLIPYKVDNVLMKYEGQNLAKGYATGIDLKLNGEFVENAESWVGLSFMSTREDQANDSYTDNMGVVHYPGYYARPSDQLVNFNLFFQDYLPSNPSYKMNITILYGSRLPTTSPYIKRYDLQFTMPSYRRVDIGFSKLLFGREKEKDGLFQSRMVKNGWIGLEVFNLLDISNTISYSWLRTISSESEKSLIYAVPNYLTLRRINMKINLVF